MHLSNTETYQFVDCGTRIDASIVPWKLNRLSAGVALSPGPCGQTDQLVFR